MGRPFTLLTFFETQPAWFGTSPSVHSSAMVPPNINNIPSLSLPIFLRASPFPPHRPNSVVVAPGLAEERAVARTPLPSPSHARTTTLSSQRPVPKNPPPRTQTWSKSPSTDLDLPLVISRLEPGLRYDMSRLSWVLFSRKVESNFLFVETDVNESNYSR